MSFRADLAVLFDHPEWQKPLFQALERRAIRYLPVDLKKAAFSDGDAQRGATAAARRRHRVVRTLFPV